jgi:hypothetical protein
MALSKFLTYWSLLFAILTIWGFSVLVALIDAKDELRARMRKPLAGR